MFVFSTVPRLFRVLVSVAALVAAIGILTPNRAAAVSVTTEQLTSDSFDRAHMAFSGDKVVYDSLRNGNRDIYMYDLSTGVESRITTNSADQYWPHIDGDRIAYFDKRNGTQYSMGGIPYFVYYPEVYVYDLALGTETRVSRHGYGLDGGFPHEAPAEGPKVKGDRVYWADHEWNGEWSDVWVYNVLTRTTQRISSPNPSGDWGNPEDHSVSIYGDHMVFYADDYFHSLGAQWWSAAAMVYKYDFATSTLSSFSPSRPGEPFEPMMWGDRILGRERDATFYGTWDDAVVYDYATGTRTRLTNTSANEHPVDLWGDRALWESDSNGQMHLADLVTGNFDAWQLPPGAALNSGRISGDHIAWVDTTGDLFVATIVNDAAPVTTSSIDEAWHSGEVMVTLSATGPGGTPATYYRIGDGPTETYSGPFPVSAQGRTSVRYWSVSVGGTTEAVNEDFVQIDSTDPIIGVRPMVAGGSYEIQDNAALASTPNEKWRTAYLKLYLEPTDTSGAAIHYTINDGTEVVMSGLDPIYFAAGTDGSKKIEYWAVDTAGNSTAVSTTYVNFDGFNPVTTTAAANAWRSVAFDVSLTATDSTSGVAHTYWRTSTNGSNWGATNEYTGAIPFDQEGSRFLQFWSVDVAGRVESATTINVGIDRTPPSTWTDAWQDWNSYGDYFAFYSSDSMSGIASTWYRVNGGMPTLVILGQDQWVGDEGDNLIEFWSYDAVGNREATQTAHIRVDSKGPTVSSNIPNAWPPEGYMVELYADDDGSGVREIHYSMTGRKGAPSQGDTLYSGPFWVPYGEIEITYYAIDYTGLVSTYARQPDAWGIDHTAPTDFQVCGSCHTEQLPAEHELKANNCGTCHIPSYRRHEPTMCNSSGCHPSPLPGSRTYTPGSAYHSGCETCHVPSAGPDYNGHENAMCDSCHLPFWDGLPRIYEPEVWWFPHEGCESCHGFPVPLTDTKKALIRGEKACESCHKVIHPDYLFQHETTTNMSACYSCHQSNLINDHADCAICHTAPSDIVKAAMVAQRTDCEACHGAPHEHQPAAIDAMQANGEKLCTDCHSTDLMTEHSKSSSVSSATGCSACHAAGGPLDTMARPWDGSCATVGCHSVQDVTRAVHQTYCEGCHAIGNPDFASLSTEVGFATPAVDKGKCDSCHWVSNHFSHGSNKDGCSCHTFAYPATRDLYVSSVSTPYGYFSSADSPDTDAATLHDIHVRGSWPQDVSKTMAGLAACKSCHAPAGCAACHDGAAPAHGEHGASDPGNAAVAYRTAAGAPSGSARGTDTTVDTVSGCVSPDCHGTDKADTGSVTIKVNHTAAVVSGSIQRTTDFTTLRAAGARATLQIEGEGDLTLYNYEYSYGAIARVTVDGGTPVLVDTYAVNGLYNVPTVIATDLAAGTHTVVVENTAMRNPLATGARVNVMSVRMSTPGVDHGFKPACSSCHGDKVADHTPAP